jgi:hypothetical protein
MSAPHFNILTTQELTIDLSRPAMEVIERCIAWQADLPFPTVSNSVQCEIDNFRNMLLNLLERSEPKPENFDLIGG